MRHLWHTHTHTYSPKIHKSLDPNVYGINIISVIIIYVQNIKIINLLGHTYMFVSESERGKEREWVSHSFRMFDWVFIVTVIESPQHFILERKKLFAPKLRQIDHNWSGVCHVLQLLLFFVVVVRCQHFYGQLANCISRDIEKKREFLCPVGCCFSRVLLFDFEWNFCISSEQMNFCLVAVEKQKCGN